MTTPNPHDLFLYADSDTPIDRDTAELLGLGFPARIAAFGTNEHDALCVRFRCLHYYYPDNSGASDLYLWPDGTTCTGKELAAMLTWKSDDFRRLQYGSMAFYAVIEHL